ncbi:MAG: response regulator, partial [Gammaproteobacteria bacterium]|nr:response regulator [Gammaproteobacteria bacterium]
SRISRNMISAIASGKKPDWDILETASRNDAFDITAKKSFDVATLGLNMPGMDGLALAEKLKKNYVDAEYSLLTANIQETIKQKAENLNSEFIGKPITEQKISDF